MGKKLPEKVKRINNSHTVRIGKGYIKIAEKHKGKQYKSAGRFVEDAIMEKHVRLTAIPDELKPDIVIPEGDKKYFRKVWKGK